VAASKKKTATENTETMALVDPLYQKFTKSVIRALGSTDFYNYFMDAVSHAENHIQFSNRKTIKTVDLTWVDAIEESLPGFQTIINSPRNVIREEELIVNVANAKRTGTEVVQHLAQHSSLVENFDDETGDVRPSKLMQRYREDSTELYENRLVFSALEAAHHFVRIRHDALFEAMSDEFGAKLKVQTDMDSPTEHVHMDMFLHIKKVDSFLDTDDKNFEVFCRISRLYRVLSMYMNTDFAQRMSKLTRVKGTVTKTNILKKNPNYKKIVALWDFLRSYDQIGYTIRVVEQNPEVNEQLQRDIFHNELFNYLVLKGYLQDEEDRQVSVPLKEKRRTLKPKFIKEIIEELTEDYDLPDVEIRKVLIEELTKSDLMKEESAERHRLVEEQRQRKKAEEERIRAEKAAEKERLRQEREAEKERQRLEKERAETQRLQERMEREAEERRRGGLIKKELAHFSTHLQELLERRQEAAQQQEEITERLDFSDAVLLLEEEETRRREANARLRKQKQMEKELRRQEEERQRILREEEEERARQAAAEEERQAREQQRQRDWAQLQPVVRELQRFYAGKAGSLKLRQDKETQRRAALERRREGKRD
jgi:hypothetical protein